MIGSLESYDAVALSLALKCNATVVSVHYRMAPEHVFPASGQDCFDAVRWVSANANSLKIDPAKLAVCGDSAGGNLAAVAAITARDAGVPIAAQVLIYPTIDTRFDTGSYERYATGYGALEATTVEWFMDHYLPDKAMRGDWKASPKMHSPTLTCRLRLSLQQNATSFGMTALLMPNCYPPPALQPSM